MSQTTLEHPVEEFVGQEARVSVHRKPACRIEMHVKTSFSLVQKARKEAVKAINKEVALPGFRKGRAPEEIIAKKFPNDIEREFHKTLADAAFVEAQKAAKIPVLNNNSSITFDLKKQDEEGAELVFTFETEPKVPSVDAQLFTPKPVARAQVSEKEIEEAVRQMQFFYAQWKPVLDRPVQDGDYIMIDLDTVEGEETQRVFHHIRFEVSKERMADWMKKLVQGAKTGDVLEGMSEVDDTATEEEKNTFKPKKVRISLLKVEEAILPAIDEEFAKKVGAKDAAHMRESIAEILNRNADEQAKKEMREQVSDFLIGHYPFELPQSLIDTERKHRHAQQMQDPKLKASWDKMSLEERKKHEAELADEASQAVRLFYLSRQFVNDAKIPVTHKDVQDEAIQLLQSHGNRNIDADRIPKEVYALALSKVILAKAQDAILSTQQSANQKA